MGPHRGATQRARPESTKLGSVSPQQMRDEALMPDHRVIQGRAAPSVPRVDVGAALQEELHDALRARGGGQV